MSNKRRITNINQNIW